MIVVRNVFRLKFGKAREAAALLKESLAIQKRALPDLEFSTRVLTDVSGPFYTLVLELYTWKKLLLVQKPGAPSV